MTKDRSAGGTLEGGDRPREEPGERLRLFLALVLPEDVERAVGAWYTDQLAGVTGIRRVDGFHITLAFLGSRPRSELEPIAGALRESAAAARPFTLEVARYRETRSVGMLVLDDPTGEAARLAGRLHERLEGIGVYEREARPWLPHLTVVRFRERPRLSPDLGPLLADLGAFAPSEAAAFVSRLHRAGARYEILDRCVVGG